MARPAIGFAGLGLMGAPMAANLLAAGWTVTGWNRSATALDEFAALGGTAVTDTAGLAGADVVIFMLPDLPVIVDAAGPLFQAWRADPPRPGTVVVVMSSVSPQRIHDFAALVAETSAGRASVVDAPVSGGTVGAAAGTLAIMVGGDRPDVDRVVPLLEDMGTTVRRMGPLGAGSLAKACNQLLVGTTTAALAEAAELAERAGLDVGALFDVLGGGLAASRVLEVVGPRLLAKDYTPTGPAKFMLKDLGFVCESARAVGAAVPMAEAGNVLYGHLVDQGLGAQDLAVVRETIARLGAEKGQP
ncbi:NAD(P)-dependent oxidoreductase [Specibacter cremeus]|uniref:NAD(P)-dependent oxidoreductase n=1 Tax=Specibacter cremeus TaxID=1629051 RepID=UPI000F7B88CA|nr:NAD(P)-dependent oxidoreductase [Specibacter cremeus]